jgi:dTMP kinase
MADENKQGCFFVFEGIDCSGKSTQARLLAKRLTAVGYSAYLTREPTDAPIGALLRSILTGKTQADNRALAPLFAADRLEHLLGKTEHLCEKIQSGMHVISDRYYFSSYAYHGVDVPMDWVISMNAPAAELLRPTCTIFIDVPVEEAMARLRAGREEPELFETRERLTQTRQKYFESFERLKNEEQVLVLDGTGSEEDVSEAVFRSIAPFLEQ